MADNVNVTPSTETNAVAVATDEISSTHYPIYKLAYGIDGVATLLSPDNPLPTSKKDDVVMLTALGKIEKQLKIMNIHLMALTGLEVDKADV